MTQSNAKGESPGQQDQDPAFSGDQDLALPATTATPFVRGDWQDGSLLMRGESYPENTYDIFDRIISWVDGYLSSSGRPLRLELDLNYLNTSSIRAMIDIFDRLQEAHDAGVEASVTWLYDARNPRSAEMGEEFREDYTFEFIISERMLM